MPDLGEFTGPVLTAYGVSLALLAGLLIVSWRSWRKVKRQLQEVEKDG